jgi:hypothetical protein
VLNFSAARNIVKRHLGEYAARMLDTLRDEVEWRKSRDSRGET